MNELIDRVRHNIEETIGIEYDINSSIKNISKEFNRMVNDGVLDDGSKYEFVGNTIKRVIQGSDDKYFGRLKTILVRYDEIVKDYRDKELSEDNINSFKDYLLVILDTTLMSLLDQDKRYIKKIIKDNILSSELLSQDEKNTSLNVIDRVSDFDIQYDNLVTNKISDIKNALLYSLKDRKDNSVDTNVKVDNGPTFNEMLSSGETTYIKSVESMDDESI